ILDCRDRVIVALVGPPRDGDGVAEDKTWGAAMARIPALFDKVRQKAELQPSVDPSTGEPPRRGHFASLSFGVSFGGGQPVRCYHVSDKHREAVGRILQSGDVKRLAGLQSCALRFYFPKAFDHMVDALRKIRANAKEPFNFSVSEYPTATANLGPRTACVAHNDSEDYPGLPCAITALGDFDPKRGGHLILWDLELIVRFPAGCTALLSSAGLRHGNTSIAEDQRRYSFTQYCPGGLFRWHRYQGKLVKDLERSERAKMDEEGDDGWEDQLSRFSTPTELKAHRERLRG
ncbi:hypothetical protein BC834DRAFT_829601, partial [Gloeopeniophorella convolvens]